MQHLQHLFGWGRLCGQRFVKSSQRVERLRGRECWPLLSFSDIVSGIIHCQPVDRLVAIVLLHAFPQVIHVNLHVAPDYPAKSDVAL